MNRRYKSIDIAPEFYEEFTQLAGQYDLTNKALLEAMISYFKATKVDPRNLKADNPTDAIKALDKRLISFIRQQEKERLTPISDDLKLIIKLLNEDLPKTLRQSNIRTIGAAMKPELLTDRFVRIYEELKQTNS